MATLSPDEAAANVQAILTVPHCRALADGDGFWSAFQQVTQGLVVRGNLVPDAHLAAVLRQHGIVKLHTDDKGFRRFDSLQVIDPMT